MFTLRRLTPDDIDHICRHRENMFREAGKTEDLLASMAGPFSSWLEPRLADGRYFGFMAELDRKGVIGGVGMMVLDWPPHPLHPEDGRRGYVLNVFVEKEHRARGIAKALMAECDAECKRQGLQYAILHPTMMAKPMYEQLGWANTNEMARLY